MIKLRTLSILLTCMIAVYPLNIAKAEPDNRNVVRDHRGQVVRCTNGCCVRSKGMTDKDQCAPQLVAQHVTQIKKVKKERLVFTEAERTVFFDFDRSSLSQEAQDRLNTLAKKLKTDQSIKEARIVGYADRIGSASYNVSLSQRRAETVRTYLTANGYTNARVTETEWVGESEPSTTCPEKIVWSDLKACLQNDRRVEVKIEYVQE